MYEDDPYYKESLLTAILTILGLVLLVVTIALVDRSKGTSIPFRTTPTLLDTNTCSKTTPVL